MVAHYSSHKMVPVYQLNLLLYAQIKWYQYVEYNTKNKTKKSKAQYNPSLQIDNTYHNTD